MSKRLGEHVVEEAAVGYFSGAGSALRGLGYAYRRGDALDDERGGPAGVVLVGRLRAALRRLNPGLPPEALDEAARALLHPESPSVEETNRAFTRWLAGGYPVEVRLPDGRSRGAAVRIVDPDDTDANDWLVVNQLTITETTAARNVRRPDLVVYLNGLPVAVFELKDPTAPGATLAKAWNQLQTYRAQVPSLFGTNVVLVVSDGVEARVGSLTAPLERFGPWRTDAAGRLVPDGTPRLRALIEGLFERRQFLDYLQHGAFWEQDPTTGRLVKKTAGYHQVQAVDDALAAVLAAQQGDGRAGVVWHTQGSGKSVTMAFFAGKALRAPALANPTLVFLTDRTDLDDQLFAQFAAARDLLPAPVQATSREHLRELLATEGGGLVFTTLQKFGTARDERMPVLTERRNVVVVADEAHRSHYAFVEGYARNLRDALPHATYLAFTGTPVELQDRSTRDVFGADVSTYTISQSVEDGATVPIYYESRLAALDLPPAMVPFLDEGVEGVTETDEVRADVTRRWKQVEAVVGLPKRLRRVAEDLVAHYERRTETLEGKAMVVCMSRKIAAALYREIVRLRPAWHDERDTHGAVKVVITGDASDDAVLMPHIRSGERRRLLESRFKEPVDEATRAGRAPLRIVLVRDMWLTGFDVPSAHTLYVDKPMRGHTLMQAIARVNRVFRDKPGGLVVDYIGLAEYLREAVQTYAAQHERPALSVEEALDDLRGALRVVRGLLGDLDLTPYLTGAAEARVAVLSAALDRVLGLDAAPGEDGRERSGAARYHAEMGALNRNAARALHLEAARDLRDEVGFFQRLQATLRKKTFDPGTVRRDAVELAIRQLVSTAVQADGVVDVFEAAGLARPDLSVLSDAFFQHVQAVPQPHLQVELLRRVVRGEVRSQERRNVVLAERFSDALQETLHRYRNRAVETAEVVAELIEMAKALRDAPKRGEALGLDESELAFYDALLAQAGVEGVMDDATLGAIARDVARAVRASVTLDWQQKASVRAEMRARVKRLLRRHGYPPEGQDSAVETVLRQAEALSNTETEGA